jgi:hypothetical protein
MNLEKVKQVIMGAAEYEDSNIPGESAKVAEGIFDKIKLKENHLPCNCPSCRFFWISFTLKLLVTKAVGRKLNFFCRS